jgi:hypothetical protein
LAPEKYIYIRREKVQKRGSRERSGGKVHEITRGKVKGISWRGREREFAVD